MGLVKIMGAGLAIISGITVAGGIGKGVYDGLQEYNYKNKIETLKLNYENPDKKRLMELEEKMCNSGNSSVWGMSIGLVMAIPFLAGLKLYHEESKPKKYLDLFD